MLAGAPLWVGRARLCYTLWTALNSLLLVVTALMAVIGADCEELIPDRIGLVRGFPFAAVQTAQLRRIGLHLGILTAVVHCPVGLGLNSGYARQQSTSCPRDHHRPGSGLHDWCSSLWLCV